MQSKVRAEIMSYCNVGFGSYLCNKVVELLLGLIPLDLLMYSLVLFQFLQVGPATMEI